MEAVPILKTLSKTPLMARIDPALIDIRIKELHGKKILITMCLFWLEARFACFATDHSAGQRDRGKNVRPNARTQIQRPTCQGQGGAEGPDAGSLTEEGPKAPDDSAKTSAPWEKSFRQKLKTDQRYYTRLHKTQNSAIQKTTFREVTFPISWKLETWQFLFLVYI